MLSLGVQEGDVLKTLSGDKTQRDRAVHPSQRKHPVDPQVWTCQDKGRECSLGCFKLEVFSFL